MKSLQRIGRRVSVASRLRLLAALTLTISPPAFAQIAKVTQVMTGVQTLLVGLGVTILTIAFLWVAYKMAFQHAKWAEVAHVVYGGILGGGAPAFAAWLMN